MNSLEHALKIFVKIFVTIFIIVASIKPILKLKKVQKLCVLARNEWFAFQFFFKKW